MSLSKTYSFSSERLTYRGITHNDAQRIVKWRNDPKNYENFLDPKPITLESHLSWFEIYLEDETRFDFMIFLKDVPIGTCGLSDITPDSCEANYMIGEVSSRGNGYATETLKTLIDVAFNELQVEDVYCRILKHNVASVHVAEAAGMKCSEYLFSYKANAGVC